MTIEDFIEVISEAVKNKVHGSPAKTFKVQRFDTEGNKFDQLNATLPQLLAENTDELRLRNRMTGALIREMEMLRRELRKANGR
jgi:hypothetical protein